ncbi:hypothetical protein PVAG01_03002 [Phlyctema vagabunda]|uniref:Uncharacterized protein n=1 Tax=Phlyctema vagabunda TaxID=108571 RepID=A0ABR4PSA8_9HELO
MSDDRQFLLSFAPSLTVRLLRQEATLLSSEATLVHFIANSKRETSVVDRASGSSQYPQLSDLIPKLLKHSSNNREMAYPYSIFEPTAGAPLSTLSIYLSLSERRVVDKQVGSMARALASLTSPSGTFGVVSKVLQDPFPSGVPTVEPTGAKTWPAAFNSLLEGILRDGEDMSVLLPYEVIRSHYQRLAWRLEVVTLPRLTVLDAGTDMNVMVEREVETSDAPAQTRTARLTGLRSWSQGCFGDPLLSSCWEEPSEGFLEGWRENGDDIFGDEDEAHARLLLYRTYTALVGIVTEYYRPQADSSRRELHGRRKLTSVLAELEKIDTAPCDESKRARSRSQDAESSKRLKSEGNDMLGI